MTRWKKRLGVIAVVAMLVAVYGWWATSWDLSVAYRVNVEGARVALAFSPDGRSVLVNRGPGRTLAWVDLDAGAVRPVPVFGGSWTTAAVSPDGSMIAIASCLDVESTGSVVVVGLADGTVRRRIEFESPVRLETTFPPDKEELLILINRASSGLMLSVDAIEVWDTSTWEKKRELVPPTRGWGHFVDRGRALVRRKPEGTIASVDSLPDFRSLPVPFEVQLPMAIGLAMGTRQERRLFATCFLDGSVSIWGPENGPKWSHLSGHRRGFGAFGLLLSPDGRWLSSGGNSLNGASTMTLVMERFLGTDYSEATQNEVVVHDVTTGKAIACLPAQQGAVFSPDSRFLATVGPGGPLRVWRLP